ncbi:hypothetical protein WK39_27265 [Burkholderia cepacia]|nr:hypothetical protein WK39_27265 [Burkholderia cepacia]
MDLRDGCEGLCCLFSIFVGAGFAQQALQQQIEVASKQRESWLGERPPSEKRDDVFVFCRKKVRVEFCHEPLKSLFPLCSGLR